MSISICMRLGYTGPDSLAHFLALSLPSSLTLSLFHSLILSYSCSCSHATRASNTRYMRVTRYSHSSHPGHLGLRLFGPCKPQLLDHWRGRLHSGHSCHLGRRQGHDAGRASDAARVAQATHVTHPVLLWPFRPFSSRYWCY